MGKRAFSSGSRLLGATLLFSGALFALLLFGNIARVALAPEPPPLGALAPAFTAPTADGSATLSLEAERGRVVLLDFWFMACPGCVGATPKLNRLRDRYEPAGLSLLSVSRDEGEEEALLAFMERRGIRYAVSVDSGRIAERYGVHSYPTVVLIDRDGRIRSRHPGPVTEEKLAKEIEILLAERASPVP